MSECVAPEVLADPDVVRFGGGVSAAVACGVFSLGAGDVLAQVFAVEQVGAADHERQEQAVAGVDGVGVPAWECVVGEGLAGPGVDDADGGLVDADGIVVAEPGGGFDFFEAVVCEGIAACGEFRIGIGEF